MASELFVSRGGDKLQSAIENWKLKVENLVCLDVGSSTGGFVDCLLQEGAQKVYSVDTAYGQLSWKLRNDPRVIVMERTNILYLDSLPEKVDFITIDAGWTKLEKVLPSVKKFLKPDAQIIALLKPHYEADENQREKGVVKDSELLNVLQKVREKIFDLGFRIEQEMESPLLGSGKNNKEYLLSLFSESQ